MRVSIVHLSVSLTVIRNIKSDKLYVSGGKNICFVSNEVAQVYFLDKSYLDVMQIMQQGLLNTLYRAETYSVVPNVTMEHMYVYVAQRFGEEFAKVSEKEKQINETW